jgi:RNA polymerase sigma-70 factor (ECF subfamily)
MIAGSEQQDGVTHLNKRSFMTAMEQTHGRQLRRFLSARLRGASADIPDLVQEIFMRLLRIKDHEAIRNPQAYLFTVANHVLYQYAMQRSTRAEATNPLELVASMQADTVPDPAEGLEAEQRLEAVAEALMKLSPRVYATLVMYRCEGMTLMEIGERLGVSHVMARKYLVKAIAYCDQRLEEME